VGGSLDLTIAGILSAHERTNFFRVPFPFVGAFDGRFFSHDSRKRCKISSILKVRQKREPTFFPRGKEPTSKGDVIKNRHHFAQNTDI